MSATDKEILALIERGQEITSIIGESVALVRDGREYRGACPFHIDRARSLRVSPDEQTFACRGCGARGGAVEFIIRKPDASAVVATAMLASAQTKGDA